MDKRSEVAKHDAPPAEPDAKLIDGELSLEDLETVAGAKAAPPKPIVNGRINSPLKTRFGLI